MSSKSLDLSKNYIVLSLGGESQIWQADEIWKMAMDKAHPENTKDLGYLVSSFEFEKDWDSWESHPNGDEIVYCLAGTMKMVFDESGQTREVDLAPGRCVIVPKGTWHTAKVPEPAKGLFITL